jgi:hypothetical protein
LRNSSDRSLNAMLKIINLMGIFVNIFTFQWGKQR